MLSIPNEWGILVILLEASQRALDCLLHMVTRMSVSGSVYMHICIRRVNKLYTLYVYMYVRM